MVETLQILIWKIYDLRPKKSLKQDWNKKYQLEFGSEIVTDSLIDYNEK